MLINLIWFDRLCWIRYQIWGRETAFVFLWQEVLLWNHSSKCVHQQIQMNTGVLRSGNPRWLFSNKQNSLRLVNRAYEWKATVFSISFFLLKDNWLQTRPKYSMETDRWTYNLCFESTQLASLPKRISNRHSLHSRTWYIDSITDGWSKVKYISSHRFSGHSSLLPINWLHNRAAKLCEFE